MTSRPAVSVVVPFFGDDADARALVAALGVMRLQPGDEILVADNTVGRTFLSTPRSADLRAVDAPLERSSYYARNVGVEASRNDWLLFIDSDCRPTASLLDDYFTPPVADAVGVVSGAVVAADRQPELIARYAASRGHIRPDAYRERGDRRPAGITANLLVRRAAWDAVGGFHEGVRSGADLEFCWRVQDAGWRFDRRPQARLAHEHVTSVAALRRKTIRHAGGGGWVNRHHSGAFTRPPLARHLLRCAAGVVVWALALQPRRALFKGIDALFLSFDAYGRLTGNRAGREPRRRHEHARVVVASRWPDAADPRAVLAVRAIAARGPGPVRVEALGRAERPDRHARRQVRTSYAEDDGMLLSLRALAWLVATRPRAVLADRAAHRADPHARRLRDLAPLVRRVRRAEAGATISGVIDPRLAARVAALAGRPLEGDDARDARTGPPARRTSAAAAGTEPG